MHKLREKRWGFENGGKDRDAEIGHRERRGRGGDASHRSIAGRGPRRHGRGERCGIVGGCAGRETGTRDPGRGRDRGIDYQRERDPPVSGNRGDTGLWEDERGRWGGFLSFVFISILLSHDQEFRSLISDNSRDSKSSWIFKFTRKSRSLKEARSYFKFLIERRSNVSSNVV